MCTWSMTSHPCELNISIPAPKIRFKAVKPLSEAHYKVSSACMMHDDLWALKLFDDAIPKPSDPLS